MRKFILRTLVCGLTALVVAGCGGRPPEPNLGEARPARPLAQPEQQAPLRSIPGVHAEVVPNFSFYPIVASRSLGIVHRTSCPQAQRIPEKDRKYFRGYPLAAKEGFEPCRECRPDRP